MSWLERTGPWEFKRHILIELSGAINVCIADFNGDGKPDIAAIISQQWEELYYFENLGGGNFAAKHVWGSTNEDYGSSGISVCDLNGDGRPDILYTNGDGFGPAVTPGPRPWHGVQWLENIGGGKFRTIASAICRGPTARWASTWTAMGRWTSSRCPPMPTGPERRPMPSR